MALLGYGGLGVPAVLAPGLVKEVGVRSYRAVKLGGPTEIPGGSYVLVSV